MEQNEINSANGLDVGEWIGFIKGKLLCESSKGSVCETGHFGKIIMGDIWVFLREKTMKIDIDGKQFVILLYAY